MKKQKNENQINKGIENRKIIEKYSEKNGKMKKWKKLELRNKRLKLMKLKIENEIEERNMNEEEMKKIQRSRNFQVSQCMF